MDEQAWPAVLERLLTLGRPQGYEPDDWRHSVVAGMTRGHVANLIGMLDDPSLNDGSAEEPRCTRGGRWGISRRSERSSH